MQLLDAVKWLQEQNYVHRDIKLENLDYFEEFIAQIKIRI